MKNSIIILLLFIASFIVAASVNAATIYVYVYNVNGSTVSGAQVVLYDGDWNYVSTQYTNSSGMATFALLDYGYYNYEVYYSGDATEFWGSDENFYLGSPTLTRYFHRNWPYLFNHSFSPANPNVGQQVTVQITVKNNLSYSRNVKVELWIDKSQSSPWDFHQTSSPQSVSGGGGTKTFTFYMTPNSAGTYYWKAYVKSYNDGAGDYIVTDTYPWSVAFTATVPEGDLDVYVYNVNGSPVEGATVKLYDGSWNYIDSDNTNSSGRADFNDLEYGTYNYEVYYNGGDATEFWGSDEGFQINSSNVTRYFTRNWPYLYDHSFSTTNPNVGEQVTIQITVKNNLSYSRNVKVELWIDKSQSSPWDFHQTSSPQSVSGGGGTKTFTFYMTPNSAGTYYWKAYVKSYNDGAGDYIVTDTYPWSVAFTATVPEGDLDIYVYNVNGSTVSGVDVILYDENWDSLDYDNTNSSGLAEFNSLPYGTYNCEFYYSGGDAEEFWGSDEGFQINSSNVTRYFTRNWPYLYDHSFSTTSPCVGDTVTVQITVKNNLSFSRNVKVELWIDRNQSGPWDFDSTSSSQSVNGGGTRTFTFTVPVNAEGIHYWKAHVRSWNDGTGDYIVTDTWLWTEAFTADLADLFVDVHNIGGDLIPDARVDLYGDGWAPFIDDDSTNSSGRAEFYGMECGKYCYEVYYPGGDTTEYWGFEESIDLVLPSVTRQFTRNWPYLYDHSFSTTNPNVGEQVTIQITVKNNLSYSRNVKVELWIDKSQSSPWDFHQTSSPQSVSGGGGTKTFTFYMTPNSAGTYYWKAYVRSWNDGTGDYIVTDTWLWTEAFSVPQTTPPELDGMIVFHTYTDFFNFDGTIHVLDLADDSVTDLEITGWDGCTNAHISPDGRRIVFMAVPYNNHDYNALEIILYDLNTEQITRLTNNGVADEDPKFSPNGEDIVFKRGGDLYTFDISTLDEDTLTQTASIEEWAPFYSRYGSKIFYSRRESGNDDIWQIDSDGQNPIPIIQSPDDVWYPQTMFEHSVLYVHTSSGDDILSYNLSTGVSESVNTNSPSDDSDPFFISGNYIGFSSNRDGLGYDLYIGDITSGEVWKIFGDGESQDVLGGAYCLPLVSNPDNEFFDDFSYTSVNDPEIHNFQWYIRDGQTGEDNGPGFEDAYWSPDNISFISDPLNDDNMIMRLSAITSGGSSTCVQAEMGQEQLRFFEGTYASRVFLTDNPQNWDDLTVQAFFSYHGDSNPQIYSECDFEYLAYDHYNGEYHWWGPGLYQSTWEDPNVKLTDFDSSITEGWHILLFQVLNGEVNYYVDGVKVASHNGIYYPESEMSILFQHWFDTWLGNSSDQREHTMVVDWVYHSKSAKSIPLATSQVESRVASFKMGSTPRFDTMNGTDISEETEETDHLPSRFCIFQNCPNPFNPETVIEYALPKDCQVTITIYNILGQKVRTLIDQYETKGKKSVYWDGKDENGNDVSSGVYFYRLQAGEFTQTKKMVLLR